MLQETTAPRRRSCPWTVGACVALGLASFWAGSDRLSAQQRRSYEIPFTADPVTVDGRLDESAWAKALVVTLDYETDPGENIKPPVETVCRLMYSVSYLFYSCEAFDPDPKAIRARLSDRDRSRDDDSVGLSIDPYNAQNRSYSLDMNPFGIQSDRVVTSTRGPDDSWDAVWDSAGRITDEGYVVEAAIPFASLSFPGGPGKHAWGFNMRRLYPRSVRHRISSSPADRGNSCRLCQYSILAGFEGVEPGLDLSITPTLTGAQSATREDLANGTLEQGDADFEPGLTVTWGFNPSMSLLGTLNPDFSQVEADNVQLDINQQFTLFFPERRPFFLEGSDAFQTPINAVNTRTVSDPSWGAKVTGKHGDDTLGGFIAKDDVTSILVPGVEGSSVALLDVGTQDAVVRYRRDVARASTVGVLVTNRSGGGYSNRVAGVDAELRFGESHQLSVQALGSQTRYPRTFLREAGITATTPDALAPDGHALSLFYRYNRRSWNASSSYRETTDGFRADLGFVTRVGVRRMDVRGERRWYGAGNDWYRRIEAGGSIERLERLEPLASPGGLEGFEGGLLEEQVRIYGTVEGPLDSRLHLQLGQRDRTYTGVLFPKQQTWQLEGAFRPMAALRFAFRAEGGDSIDFTGVRPGRRSKLRPEMNLLLGRHLRANLALERNSLNVDGDRLFQADVAELRLVYQFTARAFVRSIFQYTQIERTPELYADPVPFQDDNLFGQLLFTYRLSPETALFFGYTGQYNALDSSGLIETGNTLFLKLSYDWRP